MFVRHIKRTKRTDIVLLEGGGCSGERLVIYINAVHWDGRTRRCMLEFKSELINIWIGRFSWIVVVQQSHSSDKKKVRLVSSFSFPNFVIVVEFIVETGTLLLILRGPSLLRKITMPRSKSSYYQLSLGLCSLKAMSIVERLLLHWQQTPGIHLWRRVCWVHQSGWRECCCVHRNLTEWSLIQKGH